MVDLANNLRAERARKRFSLDDLAEVSGVSKSAIHACEQGVSVPRMENLLKIAAALDVSIDTLLPAPVSTTGGSTAQVAASVPAAPPSIVNHAPQTGSQVVPDRAESDTQGGQGK